MFISIITAVYNRSELLGRLYSSILDNDMKYKDEIEWIIVDDGSTDEIDDVVNGFINDSQIKISYIKKENGGKHSALNCAFNNAGGDFITIVDSDDFFVKGGLPSIFEFTSGPVTIFKHGVEVSEDFKKDNYTLDEFLGVRGDRLFVFNHDAILRYSFPENNSENFVTESVVFNKILDRYGAKCSNLTVVSGEYLNDGLSASYLILLNKNPEGVFNLIDTNFKVEDFSKEVIKQTAYHYSAIFNLNRVLILLKRHPNFKSIILIFSTIFVLCKRKLTK